MSNYCKECFKRQEKIDRLEQENKELKEERNRAVNEFNALMTDIIIDIPFTGIKNTDISIKSHLHKMQKALKALEEIREIELTACHSSSLEPTSQILLMENIIDGYEQRRIRILYKIDEVLNDRN